MNMQFLIFAIFGLVCFDQVFTLNNGLARTPPMGWLAWERFRCDIDCKEYPNDCISEKLFMDMADMLITEGWLELGYNQVNIDDCWSEKKRVDGRLVPDAERFPSGIKSLAKYMHDRGLKLGIYGDYGTETCGGYPGSEGYEKVDAETFAEWDVDMLKFDGCYSNSSMKAVGYPLMGKELNATGRRMIYSCSWPAYLGGKPPKVNYTELGEICNLWRNYGDIQDSFESVKKIINWWGDNQDFLVPAAGPGQWNDPDMLLVGDFSLSPEQSRLQFGIWAILAAPMFMSNDLRKISKDAKAVLQNEKVLKVSQDPLGIQGRRVKSGTTQLWMRPLINNELAVAVISYSTAGSTYSYNFKLNELNIAKPYDQYNLEGILNNSTTTKVQLDQTITVNIDPSGIVMFRAVPIIKQEKIVEVEEIEEFFEFDLL